MSEREMQERWWRQADEDPIHLAAMEWFARLEDPEVSLEDTMAWQEWIQADARHSEAFTRIEELSQALRQVRSPARPRALALALDRYDASVPLSRWRAPARPTFALAASVTVAVVALVWAALKFDGVSWNAPRTEVLATSIGENRSVVLKDGSKVTLGGNTQLEVAFDDGSRSLILERGEAFFVVAKDVSRPFRVRAGDTAVVALGTEFNVRRGSDRVVVAVTEGRVVVEPISQVLPLALLREIKPKLQPVHLNAGQQTTAMDEGIEAATPVKDPTAATAWQTGRFAFRLQPLRYVLEDVNRYTAKPIVVADEDIGSLVITGTVATRDVQEWIRSLERAFDLQAVEEPQRIVVQRR